MLNAEDAMGLQEDLQRMRGRRRTQADPLPTPDESGSAVAAAVVALRAQRDTQDRMRKQMDAMASERNEVAVLAKAARDTIDLMAQELSRHSGLPLETCQQMARETLSRRFDALLDQAIADRQVLRDIRRIPEEIQKRRWYSPAL